MSRTAPARRNSRMRMNEHMKSIRLGAEFYAMRAPVAAPALLGKLLCVRQDDGSIMRCRITETEAYFGEDDSACHARRGKTGRTEVLYMSGGTAYVYLCYGMHRLFNVVTGFEGFPEAVLVRAVDGHDGPGRLTKHMGITMSHNREDLLSADRLWIEDDGYEAAYSVFPRVGIAYAVKADRERLWRWRANGK